MRTSTPKEQNATVTTERGIRATTPSPKSEQGISHRNERESGGRIWVMHMDRKGEGNRFSKRIDGELDCILSGGGKEKRAEHI